MMTSLCCQLCVCVCVCRFLQWSHLTISIIRLRGVYLFRLFVPFAQRELLLQLDFLRQNLRTEAYLEENRSPMSRRGFLDKNERASVPKKSWHFAALNTGLMKPILQSECSPSQLAGLGIFLIYSTFNSKRQSILNNTPIYGRVVCPSMCV